MSQRTFAIPVELRARLKAPIGKLYRNEEVTRELAHDWFVSSLTVCIGDRTVERMDELGLSPNLEIIDMKEQRVARSAPNLSKNRATFYAINEPGTISIQSLDTLNNCLEQLVDDNEARIRIVINGEEDLLVLPVVAFFPEGSIVLYGQPNEGLVRVNVEESSESAKKILAKMGITSLKQ